LSRAPLTPRQIDALREIANIGAGHAASALSRLTGRTIRLLVPHVRSLPLREVPAVLGGAETPVTSVHIALAGSDRGNLAVVLTPDATRRLLCELLPLRPSPTPRPHSPSLGGDEVFNEAEASALLETASILCGAYASSVAQLTRRPLVTSLPGLAADMAGAVAEQLVIDFSEVSDSAVVLDAELVGDEDGFSGRILFLPHPAHLDALLRSLDIPMESGAA
jgi:chemotaxis protein CheC